MPRDLLTSAHRRELEHDSAIDRAIIAERGYCTIESRRDLAARSPFTFSGTRSASSFPALYIPMYRATGEPISAQVKPAVPVTFKGKKPVKYLSPRGVPNHLDVHPRNHARIADLSVTIWITEGVKKADALTSCGYCVVALTGVYNWRNKLGSLGDWEDVPLKGRHVVLCFDSDARSNVHVARAMERLGRWCRSKGAASVRYLIVPEAV
jgi:hypothetical protein